MMIQYDPDRLTDLCVAIQERWNEDGVRCTTLSWGVDWDIKDDKVILSANITGETTANYNYRDADDFDSEDIEVDYDWMVGYPIKDLDGPLDEVAGKILADMCQDYESYADEMAEDKAYERTHPDEYWSD